MKINDTFKDDFNLEVGKTYQWTANEYCSIDFTILEIRPDGEVVGQEVTDCDSTLPHVYAWKKGDLTSSNTSKIEA